MSAISHLNVAAEGLVWPPYGCSRISQSPFLSIYNVSSLICLLTFSLLFLANAVKVWRRRSWKMNESNYDQISQPAGVFEIHRSCRQTQAESQTSGWHHLHGNTILTWRSQAARNVCETAKILSEADLLNDLLLPGGAAPLFELCRLLRHIRAAIAEYQLRCQTSAWWNEQHHP